MADEKVTAATGSGQDWGFIAEFAGAPSAGKLTAETGTLTAGGTGMTSDFEATRRLFHLPEGVIYLDGNSLGPMPIAAKMRVSACVTDEWG